MALREGTYPPNPRYSLRVVVGYACACEEGGMAMGLARDLCERFLGFMARSIRSKPSDQPLI